MSAIAGIIRLDGAPVTGDEITRLAGSTPHIVRDRVDRWIDGPAGFVYLHLATTTETDIQPVVLDSGTVVLFDGRIDDRDLLLAAARRDGVDATSGDATLVAAAFERFGDDAPAHLVGDYAVAVWQRRQRRLFLARSPVGIRPLLWHRSGHLFAFATEPAALIDGVGVPRRPNEGALAEFLSARFTSQTETLWQDIQRVPPGSAITLDDRSMRRWHVETGPYPPVRGTPEDVVDAFRARFDDAIGSSLRSAGEVAASLSGGLDSSAIVCRATDLHRAGRVDRQVVPVTTRFQGQPYDEAPFSSAVEAHTGVPAVAVAPTRFSWERALTWCVSTRHLPLRPNVLSVMRPTFAYAEAAGIRVLLTGEGGDDWLGGGRAHWPDLVRAGRVAQVWRESITYRRGPLRARLRRLAADALLPSVSPARRATMVRGGGSSLDAAPWIQPAWAKEVELIDRWRQDPPEIASRQIGQRARAARYTSASAQVNLDNAFALAATHGVETRHPFHDLRLTRFVMTLPGAALRRGDRTKLVLREAMRDTLPEVVRTRSSKAGFRGPFIEAIEVCLDAAPIASLQPVQRGWVRPEHLESCWSSFRRWHAGGETTPVPDQHLGMLWFTIAAHLWLEAAGA